MKDQTALYEEFISREMFDAIPDAIGIYQRNGLMVAGNRAWEVFWRLPHDNLVVGNLNLLEARDVHPEHVAAFKRALEGEIVSSPVVEINLSDNESFGELGLKHVWMATTMAPIRGTDGEIHYVMCVFHDRSELVLAERRIAGAEDIIASQRETIEALRTAKDQIKQQQNLINQLSVPIIEIWPGVVLLPVIGLVDERRASEMTERVLASVSTLNARHVILDLTGAHDLDTTSAGHLLRILQAVQLLGASAMIAGIRPDVARLIVELGISLDSTRTVRNLRSALANIIQKG